VQQDSVPSPFQQDSPTQVFLPPKNQVRQLSQLTPNSSLAADDKKIVQLYLAHPSAINVYHQRVTHLLTQSALVSMEYFDRGETVPTHMKEERLALVKKNEAYKRLSGLGESYKNLLAEKKVVASQLSELVNLNDDSTLQEERLASISQDLRNIEKDLGNLLQTSGAIEDGFGTGLYILASGATSSSRIHDNHIPLPSGSSLIGSAQMIEQTQFPSLPGNPTSQITRLASTSRDRSAIISANVRDVSPSPVRSYRPTSQANEGSVRLKEARNGPQRSLKQPDFYHEPTPVDYDFDEDNEAFEQLVKDDQKLQYESRINGSKPSTEVPREIEENYGDSDFDDDMEGVAQEVERRHSGMAPPRNQDKQQALSENVRNISESSRKSLSKPRKDMYSHIDLENSGLFKHPWSNDVKKVLKERFRLRGFRYHQLEAINATLSGQDAFVLMPTGGGKSLCYQLPAIVQSGKHKGVTIVISPLLSLMNDQVQHLRALSIRAATVNSETSPEERHEVLANLNETHPEQYIQLLYLTPEMVVKSNNMSNILTRLHKNKKLARFVIDEAHCVSQWGHDFRKDYVALGLVRQKYPNVPIMALTATATENVKVDVMHNLGMGKCPEFAQSFNRPNLYYEVRSKQKKKAQDILKEMVDLVTKKYKGQTGIIYTLSRKNCEDIASKLSTEHKVKVHHFHAALSAEEKTKVQKDWQSGKLQVVVATIAFGMGIDKPDVRFVIHHMIPKSLEGYYQETGRAGRDGKKSGCYLFYGYQDTTMLKRFIHDSEGSYEQKERQRKMLQQMIRYCEERSECRRVQVLDYFGEKFAREDCQNTCDNCKSDATFEDVDFTKYAQAALQVVKKVCKDDVTLLHCVDVVRGVSNSKVKSFGHSEISEFGFAKDLTRGEVERVFYRLVMENALREENIINRSGFAASYMRVSQEYSKRCLSC
jgi:bloom syndrome protein